MLAEHGPPPLWAVVEAIDGDPTSARYEQWFYPEAGVIAAFLDGSLDGEMEVTWTNEEATTVSSPVSPVHLDASMTPEDVDALVGTPAVELEALQTDLGVVYSRGYPDAHLVVQFLHDRVYTAQTP